MSEKITEKTEKLVLENDSAIKKLFGNLNSNLLEIEKICGVKIDSRGGNLFIKGGAGKVNSAKEIISQYYELISEGYKIEPGDFAVGAEIISGKKKLKEIFLNENGIRLREKTLFPKSPNQIDYIRAMRRSFVIFGSGPSGTGKTFLAVAMAMSELAMKNIGRIIITRPMIEAGEKLGFLPGDLQQKADPYLRPFFDAIYEIAGVESAERLMERKTIEIAPLAYMRGRTLSKAFVILDEAQNTTSSQMKMFLTRLGLQSRAVITGDTTQTDLPAGSLSGLAEAEELLGGMEGVEFVRFSSRDVVRHPIVKKIIDAYERPNGKKLRG